MNYEPAAVHLTTSPQWRRTVESTGHSFTGGASWTVRGSNVIGEMQGCVRCCLVLINHLRGALLLAPSGVKRKLDRVALKIGRKQWLGLRPEERMAISRLPSESKEECEALRIFIRGVL